MKLILPLFFLLTSHFILPFHANALSCHDYTVYKGSKAKMPEGIWPNYFEIALKDTKNTLKKKIGLQSWNRNYDKARLFFAYNQLGPIERQKGKILSNALTLQYKMAYSRPFKRSPFSVCSGKDLLKLITYHLKHPLNDIQFFSYVIVPNKKHGPLLRFSPSGEGAVGIVSKHILHAKGAKSVYYAGELRINCPGQNLDHCQVRIDNNSGTYAPNAEHLPSLIELLKKNFPNLDIVIDEKTTVRNGSFHPGELASS